MQNEELHQSQVALEESRDRYTDLYEFAPVGYLTLSRDGIVTSINLTGAEMLGEERKTALNRHFAHYVMPEDADRWHLHLQDIIKSGKTQSCELHLRCDDGIVRFIHLDSSPREISEIVELRITLTDVTERKFYEEGLLIQSKRAQALLELPMAAETLDEASFMQRGQELAEDITGSQIAFIHFVNDEDGSIELVTWSRRTLEKYCHAAYDKHYPVSNAGIWADALRLKKPVMFNDYASYPNKHGLPEGHSTLTRLISVPVIEHGKVVMLTGVGNKATNYTDLDVETVQLISNDIWKNIQRNRTQKKLKRFSLALEHSSDEIYIFDCDTLLLIDVNMGGQANLGYSLLELQQMTPLDILPEFTAEKFGGLVAPLCSKKVRQLRFETVQKRKSGEIYPVEIHLELTNDDSPQFVAIIRDITERKRYESEREAQLRLISTEHAKLLASIKQVEQTQIQLLQAEKMSAIGLLAEGIAHEINNPVGYVSSNLSTLEKYLADIFVALDKYEAAESLCKADDPLMEELRKFKEKIDLNYLRTDTKSLLTESHQGMERVKKIILDLKEFAHSDSKDHWVWTDVHKGLDSTLNVVWNELKYKCELVKEYATLPDIYCLPSELNQVFMNLLMNAAQAIEVRGTIILRTGHEGELVWIEVSDTGSGIPPEIIPRLFDAFFTTKPAGKGTGLGLSISYKIVEKHHGKIEVQSEVGTGSTFRVWLPIQQPDIKETS